MKLIDNSFKTNWKYIAILVFVAVVVAVGEVFLFRTMEPAFSPPMGELTLSPCDLNADGQCDTADYVLFQDALGKRRGDLGYNPFADADVDGVITAIDQQMLFPVTSPAPQPQAEILDTSTWQTYRNEEEGFEVRYPADSRVTKTSYGPRIMLPIEGKGTNLSEKYLDISIDGPSAHTGPLVSSEQVSLGGNLFAKETRGGAAAGNIYDTDAYLINYDGKAYNLSFTLHSGNIGNYDSSIRPKEFDKEEESEVFNQILSTFRFVE